MQTTDLTIKEADLNIVYGPYYMGEEVNERALASVKYMYTDLTDIRKYYIRLGFHLNEFNVDKSYLEFGYSTLEEFCDVNLGLDKSAVSRCINVFREFNASHDRKFVGDFEAHGSAMDLSERWKDYSYTQLCEMLPLTEHERKQITPDMTVKQIREYKKSLRDREKASKELDKGLRLLDEVIQKSKESVASTQPEDTEDSPVASTQLFDLVEWMPKTGIVRYNYVKKCDPVENGRCKTLRVFDSRGKEIIYNITCDILLENDGNIVIRMNGRAKSLEWDEENNE